MAQQLWRRIHAKCSKELKDPHLQGEWVQVEKEGLIPPKKGKLNKLGGKGGRNPTEGRPCEKQKKGSIGRAFCQPQGSKEDWLPGYFVAQRGKTELVRGNGEKKVMVLQRPFTSRQF